MRFFFYLFLAINLLPAAEVRASSAEKPDCEAALTAAICDVKNYRENHCYLNVWNIISFLRKQNVSDLDQVEVIYVLPPLGTTLRAMNSRQGPRHWQFHVIIKFKNKIYDMDNLGSESGVSVQDYVRQMFLYSDSETQAIYSELGISSDFEDEILSDLQVRKIPARDYLNDYQGYVRDFNFYRHKAENEYPLMHLLTALAIKESEISPPRDKSISRAFWTDEQLERQGSEVFAENYIIHWNAWGYRFSFNVESRALSTREVTATMSPAKYHIQSFLRRIVMEKKKNPSIKTLFDLQK